MASAAKAPPPLGPMVGVPKAESTGVILGFLWYISIYVYTYIEYTIVYWGLQRGYLGMKRNGNYYNGVIQLYGGTWSFGRNIKRKVKVLNPKP